MCVGRLQEHESKELARQAQDCNRQLPGCNAASDGCCLGTRKANRSVLAREIPVTVLADEWLLQCRALENANARGDDYKSFAFHRMRSI